MELENGLQVKQIHTQKQQKRGWVLGSWNIPAERRCGKIIVQIRSFSVIVQSSNYQLTSHLLDISQLGLDKQRSHHDMKALIPEN
jgi:hypothetical protein